MSQNRLRSGQVYERKHACVFISEMRTLITQYTHRRVGITDLSSFRLRQNAFWVVMVMMMMVMIGRIVCGGGGSGL